MNQVQRKKLNLEAESERGLRYDSSKKAIKIVAEGDSWFDYPFVLDTIDWLREMGYFIHKNAVAMDTLENMVYGTDYKIIHKLKGVKNFGPRDLQETMTSIRKHKPRFVLFSGGGNDIVGKDLSQYLFHKHLTDDVFREDLFRKNIEKFIKPAIKQFCDYVWKVDANIDIMMDGYDYAKPNGKAYAKIIGPWLLPTFGAKAITDRTEQDAIIKKLIDGFNEVLVEFDNSFPKFHHIDLRGMFPDDKQWHNEIHLRAVGYKLVAFKYHDKMQELLKSN